MHEKLGETGRNWAKLGTGLGLCPSTLLLLHWRVQQMGAGFC